MSSELSVQDIQLVRDSWSAVRKDRKTFGNQLFINLFTKYPEYQKLFKSFENIPLSELGSSKKLLAHTTNVVYTLTALIDTLDEPEALDEMLTKAGERHDRRNIPVDRFTELAPILFDLLKTTLGPKYDDQTHKAWDTTYSLLVKKIGTGYQ